MRRPRALPDYLRPGLKLVFVGINPGLKSATAGHYYANPRNPFWRFLHEAGLTAVRLAPSEDVRLLEHGYGLTDIVKRPSRGVGDLAPREFREGKKDLENKLLRIRPLIVCFNSKSAFVGFFGREAFRGFGRQRVRIGRTRVYVLPSTSPANAGIPLPVKRRYFRGLKRWLDQLQIVRLPPRASDATVQGTDSTTARSSSPGLSPSGRTPTEYCCISSIPSGRSRARTSRASAADFATNA